MREGRAKLKKQQGSKKGGAKDERREDRKEEQEEKEKGRKERETRRMRQYLQGALVDFHDQTQLFLRLLVTNQSVIVLCYVRRCLLRVTKLSFSLRCFFFLENSCASLSSLTTFSSQPLLSSLLFSPFSFSLSFLLPLLFLTFQYWDVGLALEYQAPPQNYESTSRVDLSCPVREEGEREERKVRGGKGLRRPRGRRRRASREV